MNENWVDSIVQDNTFSYSYYKKLVDNYLEIDWREITIQNRVVTPLLDRLFINEKDISIIDISTQYDNKNSKIHDTRIYRKEKTSPPDLLVARHWNYANIDNDKIDYLAVVEVKSPSLDPVYNKDKNKFDGQIKTHLEVNDKVILTDCIKWLFFEKEYGLDPVKTISLFDENNNWKRKDAKTPESLIEEIQFEPTYEDEPKDWNQLCKYILEFLNGN
ncbi:hypothetical protein CWR48_04975 [Oceanobacillus arenosus]|uniref:Uncharacterized protein n=1 Tax=Oceanobacillus arenosus TaxID=1229153 RepID=A0A3D8PY49_9BACI|nr:hypothetical protein [Oceanobacillus arenosus]RDW20079.1 hypothetical protein CWR48_04975 [Oceanobacillus arenosus]